MSIPPNQFRRDHPIFFKDNVNEWVAFACDGTGPADESKRTKRIQGWSCLNWLGGILIIVSLHIHLNKLSISIFAIIFSSHYDYFQFLKEYWC